MIRLRPGTSVFEILHEKFPSQWDARVHLAIIVVLMMMVKKGCCIGYDEVYIMMKCMSVTFFFIPS